MKGGSEGTVWYVEGGRMDGGMDGSICTFGRGGKMGKSEVEVRARLKRGNIGDEEKWW